MMPAQPPQAPQHGLAKQPQPQPVVPQVPPRERLNETVWTALDRKATAIAEFTLRQYRTRKSTWTVGAIGMMLVGLVLLFYAEAMTSAFDNIDDDGDSYDEDGDGYPMGQERMYGTSDWNPYDYPGAAHFEQQDRVRGQYVNISGNGTFYGYGEFTYTWLDNETYQSVDYWNHDSPWVRIDELQDCDGWAPWNHRGCIVDEDTIRVENAYIRGDGIFEAVGWSQIDRGIWHNRTYIEPMEQSQFIDEDDIDWDGNLANRNQGFDDDGDCTEEGWNVTQLSTWQKDRNGDGIDCNVLYRAENGQIVEIDPDTNVDEDPDDSAFSKEVIHRTFVLGFGRMGFLFILGIFIPLFLATGLIRDEYEEGTLHYLVGKPIARAEILAYRLLGFIGLAWPYMLGLITVSAIISGLLGPSESFFRFGDLGVWLGVGLAACLAMLTYGALFSAIGVMAPRFGILICLFFAVWEFFMMFLSMINGVRTQGIAMLSVSFWASEIINATAWLIWSDATYMKERADAFSWADSAALETVWLTPFPFTYPLANLIVSILVLIMLTAMFIGIGQAAFKRRELH